MYFLEDVRGVFWVICAFGAMVGLAQWGRSGSVRVRYGCQLTWRETHGVVVVAAMFSDPGAVAPEDGLQSGSGDAGRSGRQCDKCGADKRQRVHHCRSCGRCVEGMDHHCPWVNNCVGDGNRKPFLLFVMYTLLACLHGAYLLIQWFLSLNCRPRSSYLRCVGTNTFVVVAMMVVGVVLFGGFTAVMLVTQLQSIVTNTTQIDRYHGIAGKRGSALSELSKYFGPIGVWWLWPGTLRRPKRASLTAADASSIGNSEAWTSSVYHMVLSAVITVGITRVIWMVALLLLGLVQRLGYFRR